jgi:hypothetical protein
MKQRGYSEPIAEQIEECQLTDSNIDEETKELVHIVNNLSERTDIFESFENTGFDVGRNYDWSRKFSKVSRSIFDRNKLFSMSPKLTSIMKPFIISFIIY